MIVDIFLPEKIGSYYFLAKRFIGFDIGKTHIYASQVLLKGNTVTLEKFYQEQLDHDNAKPYEIRVGQAIKTIMDQVPRGTSIRTCLSSSVVIFKELTLPFLEHDKIAMVVAYEVEQFLPFALHDAVLDFIVTARNTETKGATILVAAAKKIAVAEQLRSFEVADYQPTTVTVDLFDLYGLYLSIPAYAASKETVVFIDIELFVTRIAFIAQGNLKFIRTLPKGIMHCAKKIGQERAVPNGQALEDFIRFGLTKHDDSIYEKAALQACNAFFNDIQFTLQSCQEQLKTPQPIASLMLLGQGATINGFDDSLSQALGIPCTLFNGNELLKNNTIKIKSTLRIPPAAIISLGTALPTPVTEQFSLRREEFALSQQTTFVKQLVSTTTFFIALFVLLLVNSWWQTKTLRNVNRAMESEVIKTLNSLDLTTEKQFDNAIRDARIKVNREEELWFAFSRQRRFSFVKTLQDLSTALDRASLGLALKKLMLTSNEMILEGSVKGFEELTLLERELNDSKLFVNVPHLQELKFNQKLSLKKSGDELP